MKLIRTLASYEVRILIVVSKLIVYGIFVNFCEDQIFVDSLGFLFIIRMYEGFYTRCLRYNICSAWILGIRISSMYF